MQGFWVVGELIQGYQMWFMLVGFYCVVICEIDVVVNCEVGVFVFVKLVVVVCDSWLYCMEDGKLELFMVDVKIFFQILYQNMLEGFWVDFIYGGNCDMVGWKLIGFFGVCYDYCDFVSKYGECYLLLFVGLMGCL